MNWRRRIAAFLVVGVAVLTSGPPADASTTPQWLGPAAVAPFDAFDFNDYPAVFADHGGTYALLTGADQPQQNYDIHRAVEGAPGSWSSPVGVDGLNTDAYEGNAAVAAGEGGDHDHLYFLSDRENPSGCPLLYRADWDGAAATNVERVEFADGAGCMSAIQPTTAFGERRMYYVNSGGHAKYYEMTNEPWPAPVSVAGLSQGRSHGFYLAPDGSFAIGALECTLSGEPACLSGDWIDLFVFLPGEDPAGASWVRTSIQTVYNNEGTSVVPFLDDLGRLWWNSGRDNFFVLPHPSDGWCLSAFAVYDSFADCCPANPADCRGPGCALFDCSGDDDDDNDDSAPGDDDDDDNDDSAPGDDDDDLSPSTDDDGVGSDDGASGGCGCD